MTYDEPPVTPPGWANVGASLWRPATTGRLVMKTPYRPDNRAWIHETLDSRRVRPEWNKERKRWEVARNHFRPMVLAMIERFGVVDVILDSRSTERCDTRCREALGEECECECLGVYHGGLGWLGDWVQVAEHTLVRSTYRRRHLRLAGTDADVVQLLAGIDTN